MIDSRDEEYQQMFALVEWMAKSRAADGHKLAPLPLIDMLMDMSREVLVNASPNAERRFRELVTEMVHNCLRVHAMSPLPSTITH